MLLNHPFQHRTPRSLKKEKSMVTEQNVRETISLLLPRFFHGGMERLCFGKNPEHIMENWQTFLTKTCECLDFLASWHTYTTSPHEHYVRLPSLISLLTNSGDLRSNMAVSLWYLKHISSTVTKRDLEKHLKKMMQEITEDDLKRTLEGEGLVANDYIPLNVFAQLLYVAPLLLPCEVDTFLCKYGIEVHA